eukprot:11146851-Lingulodinium_polyedra.AAC.1
MTVTPNDLHGLKPRLTPRGVQRTGHSEKQMMCWQAHWVQTLAYAITTPAAAPPWRRTAKCGMAAKTGRGPPRTP